MKGNSVSVLLVEDDDVDAMSVTRAFKKLKVVNPLHRAENGLQALNKLRGAQGEQKLTPTQKILMLDINMPRMNGLEFLRGRGGGPGGRPGGGGGRAAAGGGRGGGAAGDGGGAGGI